MQADFDRAFEIVVGLEGGYANDPSDRGGETKYGISKRVYPMLDIAGLELEDAREIYLTDYWRRCQCQMMPQNLALMVFDCAVNQGQETAIIILQDSLGVLADGIIGPITRAAVRGSDADRICDAMAVARLLRYAGSALLHRFGRGWFRRVIKVFREGMEATDRS